MKNILMVFLFLGFQVQLTGQIDTMAFKTVEGITDKMLEMISGEVGEERDWEQYRMLFLPTAQKLSLRNRADGTSSVRARNIEEFVRTVGPLYARDGFEEYKIGLKVHEFNGIATAFQSYYCKNLIGTYEMRGVNTYQLVYVDDRWWIANTLFTSETEDVSVPNEYLFKEYQQDIKE